ncbi:MAG: hypothetical protein RBG13Loki_3464 [Promethearchaeota archaeon CR_4]|nr:MAG: hypothetical protein RBG13Loki_3464 [Candidatus Lokiarchaeota archaeon CR_4]
MSMDENLKKEIQASSPEKLAKVTDAEKKKIEEEKKKRAEELAKIKAAAAKQGLKVDEE